MTPIEFAEKILEMPVSKQNAFFERLKNELSEEDWKTMVNFISLYGMFTDKDKYQAIKDAVCQTLCEDIFGHTV